MKFVIHGTSTSYMVYICPGGISKIILGSIDAHVSKLAHKLKTLYYKAKRCEVWESRILVQLMSMVIWGHSVHLSLNALS